MGVKTENDTGLQEVHLDTNAVQGMEVEKAPARFTKRSAVGAVANFVNTAVGAGVIAVPYALHKTGFFTGIALIFVAAFLIHTGSCYLVSCGFKAKTMDYGEIMELAFGVRGYYAFSIVICSFLFGVLAAYMVIIGDNWPHFAEDAQLGHVFEDVMLSTIFFAIVALPLSMLKSMKSLSWASSFGLILIIMIDVIIVAYTPKAIEHHEDQTILEKLTLIRPISAFSGLGIISFSMVSQHATYLIYNSIPGCTYRRWSLVSAISVFIEVFFVLTIGVSGYLSFGDDVPADILEGYHGDLIVNMGRVLLTLLMVVTYPMVMFVIRHFFDQMFFQRYLGWAPPGNLRHVLLTLAFWVGSNILALSVNDLGIVLGVTGSIGASTLAYLFPALLQMHFFKDEISACRKKFFNHDFYAITVKDRLHMMGTIFAPFSMAVFAVVSLIAGSISTFF